MFSFHTVYTITLLKFEISQTNSKQWICKLDSTWTVLHIHFTFTPRLQLLAHIQKRDIIQRYSNLLFLTYKPPIKLKLFEQITRENEKRNLLLIFNIVRWFTHNPTHTLIYWSSVINIPDNMVLHFKLTT